MVKHNQTKVKLKAYKNQLDQDLNSFKKLLCMFMFLLLKVQCVLFSSI